MTTQRTGEPAREMEGLVARLAEAGALRRGSRLARLLDYLVSAELAGDGERIKAYAIGVDVLGRGADFDPSTDSIARVEVGRLRRALETYYAGAGAADRLKVTIPRGQMRPVITRLPDPEPAGPLGRFRVPPIGHANRLGLGWALAVIACAGMLAGGMVIGRATAPAAPAQMAARTTVAEAPILEVGPFTARVPESTFGRLLPGLRADLVRTLSHYPVLRVRDNPAGLNPAANGLPPARYVLTGEVPTPEDGPVLDLTLVERASGTILWAGSERFVRENGGLAGPMRARVVDIVQALAGPTGVVVNDALRRTAQTEAAGDGPASTPSSYACYLRWQAWDVSKDAGLEVAARRCLGKLIAADTGDGLIWGAYAMRTYLDWAATGGVPGDKTYLSAESAARRAVVLSPLESETHEYLADILLAGSRSNRAEAEAEIREAIALNPSRPELHAVLGWVQALRGDWAQSVAEVHKAIDMALTAPGWFRLPLAFDAVRRGDWTAAEAEARRIVAAGDPRGHVIGLAAARALGNRDAMELHEGGVHGRTGRSVAAALAEIEALFPDPGIAAALRAALGPLAQ